MDKVILLGSLVALALLGLTPPTATTTARFVPALVAAAFCLAALGLAALGIAAPGPAAPGRATPSPAAPSSAVRTRPSPVLAVTVLVFGIASLMGCGVLWQASLLIALLAAAAVTRLVPSAQFPPIRRGRVPVALTLFAGLITPGALVGWVYLLRPDLSDLLQLIPDRPLAILALGGLVFAVANATAEELVWRGVLQPSLTTEFGSLPALLLQAASFGLIHAHGFPRGVVGVLLAGTWAVLLGILRNLSEGLLAAILAHVVADATIAAIVIWLAR
ncbi:MAG TPA: CPBP family intramembrane glutamic endopeptidase [Polyangiaceae bacterium]|nr:CPBP family intramembrane glutamic endopeptidase [Polyangiaceae bacterium]